MTNPTPNNGPAAKSTTGLEGFAGGHNAAPAGVPASRAFDPSEILRALFKWKWLILAMTVLGPLLALGVSLMMSPKYQSVAQIQINQEDPVAVPGSDSSRTFMFSGQEFLATQMGLLSSRSLAQRVVEAKRLANDPEYANQALSAGERRDQATDRIWGQMSVELVRNSRLVNIKVITDNPEVAAALANSYAEQFIASNIEREFGASAYARKFLEDKLNSTRVKLEKSERDLVGYATRQGIVELAASGKDGAQPSLEASTLIALNTSLAEARNQRIIAEQRYRNSGGGQNSAEAINNTALQELVRKRAEAQAEYQEKLVVFLPGLPAMASLRERIGVLDREIGRMRGSVGTVSRGEYEGAVARERELQRRLDAMKLKVLDLRSRSIQYTLLQREVDTNRSYYDALLQKYKEVGVSNGVGSNKVAIVDRARAPKAPFSPNIPVNVLLGLLAGLVLGVGGAFLIELIDDTMKVPEDVKSKLHLTLLGTLPKADDEKTFMEEASNPKSELIEAAHSLRTALQFATGHGMPRSLLITSSRPGEGKSSVSLALATSMALLGKKVLIIDADMRKPTFYVGNASRKDTPGLSNVLNGEMQFSAVTHATEIENLSVIPAGPTVPNPAALLSDGGFANVLTMAQQAFDHIVIDGPPVMGLADAPLMGAAAEAALLVVEASGPHRSTVQTAVARLSAANTQLLGAVLNKFEARRTGYGYGYGYGYSYSYGGTEHEDENQDGRKIVLVK